MWVVVTGNHYKCMSGSTTIHIYNHCNKCWKSKTIRKKGKVTPASFLTLFLTLHHIHTPSVSSNLSSPHPYLNPNHTWEIWELCTQSWWRNPLPLVPSCVPRADQEGSRLFKIRGSFCQSSKKWSEQGRRWESGERWEVRIESWESKRTEEMRGETARWARVRKRGFQLSTSNFQVLKKKVLSFFATSGRRGTWEVGGRPSAVSCPYPDLLCRFLPGWRIILAVSPCFSSLKRSGYRKRLQSCASVYHRSWRLVRGVWHGVLEWLSLDILFEVSGISWSLKTCIWMILSCASCNRRQLGCLSI